jgi:cytochrome d ubiquinol oxidase subunit II
MNVAAFILLAAVLIAYVVLDGYDLGAGALHLFIARTDSERERNFQAIGPFWSGNEVMLVATGALLFALFPRVYAASFSGFYLPLIIVLWLFMVRGMSIELRSHFESDLWRGFWDVAFCLSSALLGFVFGLALGNVLRGVPLDTRGYFAGTFGFLLNPYALAVGCFALAALAMHGAAFLWFRGNEEVRRTRAALWPVVLLLYVGVTFWTLRVHPISASALLWIAPALGLAALIAVRFAKSGASALASSTAFLALLVVSAAQTIFPYLLPAFPAASQLGLSIYNAAPRGFSLQTGFAAGTVGLGAAAIYGTIALRRFLARP